ncbi:hypothetical protein PENTCL1PPCAC_10673, partial [Pristionchus entomophagus]
SAGSSLFTTSKEWSPLEFVPSSIFRRSTDLTPTRPWLSHGLPDALDNRQLSSTLRLAQWRCPSSSSRDEDP